jgi:hypothetical protein
MIPNKHLEIIKRIQTKYPTSHVGGSIGLTLRGYDLKRDLTKSDIDICVTDYVETPKNANELHPSGNDFDFTVEMNGIKICVVNDNQLYDVIDGINVTNFDTIIHYKIDYHLKGYVKHTNDLLNMGITIPKTVIENAKQIDDIPF